jgi:DNA-binding transcriptional ArsR family regulator
MFEESARERAEEEAHRRTEEAERAEPADDKGALAKRNEQARSHPVRVAILATLAKHAKREGLTGRQVHEHLPEPDGGPRPLSAVVYHLRVLLGVELVTATDTPGATGGAIEKVWALP